MIRLFTLLLAALPASLARAAEPPADYLRDVKPVLKARCFSCHGALKQESGLRLDTGRLILSGGDSGAIVSVGHPDQSSIVTRISSTDESLRMPPDGNPLSAQQIEAIQNWIRLGAVFPSDEQPEPDPQQHWAFLNPVRPAVPDVENTGWCRNPIDAFIAARHQQLGITPLTQARKDILLRRVYLDLIGLPPTREQLHAFLNDKSDDAYEKVVDRLLESAHYGERWGRHWMDVWRYSDWYGRRNVNDVRNSYPHIWRWRDWIINSLNEDKGYDQMIREMLAADELHPTDDSRIPALGFIVRNWFSLNYDTWKQDLVEHTGKAFLGLRLNCAHCHDHKYDPVSQEEYFRFRAFFEPLELRHDRVPGGPALTKYIRYKPDSGGSLQPIAAGLPRVYDHFVDDSTWMYRLGDTRDRMDRPPVEPGAPSIIGGDRLKIELVQLPPVAWYPGLKPFVRTDELRLRETAVVSARTAVNTAAARVTPLETRLREVRFKLDEAQQSAKRQATVVTRDSQDVIAEWRFEGLNDESGFLADSSGNGHALQRVTGTDPVAAPEQLAAEGTTRAFRVPGQSPDDKNQQAARFRQSQSHAYLEARGSSQFQRDQFSLECFVHFDSSQRNFNRTIVDYAGAWTLLHRGLDEASFELRLLYTSDKGQVRDVATGKRDHPESPSQNDSKSAPLLLHTGHDYYLCLVFGAETITLWAADLTAQTPLQSFELARSPNNTDFKMLARPTEQTPLSIGNSDGTGRVYGLIDEVRLTKTLLTLPQIAAAVGQSGEETMHRLAAESAMLARQLSAAKTAETAARMQLESAEAQVQAVAARLAADDVRYGDSPGNAEESTRAAVRQERIALLSAARAKLATAESELAAQQAAESPDEKQRKQAEQDAASARKSIIELEQQTDDGREYTSFGPQYPRTSTGRRSALARWIAGTDNPLTARVAVNHIWMRHFGRPLVESVFDFGRGGRTPTHPQLLDWLAVELMSSTDGWRMKRIHRLIVTSSTYRLSSRPGAGNADRIADQDNSSWWKFERRRLEAETVRDALLHVSGELDSTIGGPDLDPKLESESSRRSLYFTVYPEAGGMMRFMTLFDAPDPCDCYRRTESIVPQQALVMSNSTLSLNCGRRLAGSLSAGLQTTVSASASESFVTAAFEQILSRAPTREEQQTCVDFLTRQHALFLDSDTRLKLPTTTGTVEAAVNPVLRARESLVRVLLNHNDFVTLH